MVGIFTNSLSGTIQKSDMYFVSIPDGLEKDEIKDRFAQIAQTFANKLDINKVYLLYGKDEYIEYEYSMELHSNQA